MKKQVAGLILCFVASLALAGAEDARFGINMQSVPIQIVLSDYAERSGKIVERVDGVDLLLTIEGEDITRAEYLQLVENSLAEANVGLFSITSNRVVATWLDLSKVQTRDASAPGTTASVDGDEEGATFDTELQELQMQQIRDGNPTQPIPLTKEMEEQLIREGVLPPPAR